MTQNDIIRIAREACDKDKVEAWSNGFWTLTQEELERFADLVLRAERQACAKVCDQFDAESPFIGQGRKCAEIIRARGEA
jgi:hypothetical protein